MAMRERWVPPGRVPARGRQIMVARFV